MSTGAINEGGDENTFSYAILNTHEMTEPNTIRAITESQAEHQPVTLDPNEQVRQSASSDKQTTRSRYQSISQKSRRDLEAQENEEAERSYR